MQTRLFSATILTALITGLASASSPEPSTLEPVDRLPIEEDAAKFTIKFADGYPKKATAGGTNLKVIACKGTWEGVDGATRDKIENIQVTIWLSSTENDITIRQAIVSGEVRRLDIVATNAAKTTGTWEIELNEPSFDKMPGGTLTVEVIITPGDKTKGNAATAYPK